MGVDSNLYLSNRWDIEDVIDILKSDGYDPKPRYTHTPTYIILGLEQTGREIGIFNSDTPIGRLLLLSMHCDDESEKILRSIGDVLGGLFMKSDCDGEMEFIYGKLSDEDKLQYFLKYAVIHDKIDADDYDGLGKSIRAWKEKHSR